MQYYSQVWLARMVKDDQEKGNETKEGRKSRVYYLKKQKK